MPAQHALAKVEGLGRSAIPGILSTLMRLTSDAVLVFDGQARIIACNRQAEALSGFTAAELVGTDVRTLLFDANRVSEDESIEPDPSITPLPLLLDGSLAELSLRLASGGALSVGARCDRASAPGETYLLVMRAADAAVAAEREHDRLVDELSLANRRLSGTLRIVLETIDTQSLDILFSEVLEQISDTLEANGVLIYLAETDGFHLRGATRSLEGRKIPRFMAYGEGLETLVTRAGTALRLHLLPPSGRALRAGALKVRELLDEDANVRRRIPARHVPPFTSFVCVPVWFGGHVIAIIEAGWSDAHLVRRDDARLLDSVAQYLAAQLAAAISSMRAERGERLDDAAARLRARMDIDAQDTPGDVISLARDALCEVLDVRCAPITCDAFQAGCIVSLPGVGDAELPRAIDDLVRGHVDGGVAVVPINAGSDVAVWLEEQGCPATGALLDLGALDGTRTACLLLRASDAESFDDEELDFMRRIAIDVRQASQAGERRTKDMRISQALQNGMKNELQHVDGITGHGLYSSATAAATVGGDFYDLICLPRRRACVILGDVSGKGVEAASVSAAVKTALGAYAWEGQPPARMVRLLNDFLLGFSRLETFATMFVGMVDLDRATLTYCSAGHPPALLLRAETNEMETLDEQSGVVGAFKGMVYRDGRVRLGEGDRLLLYTDGITEARDPTGAFFGEQGLRDAVMDESTGDFDTLLERLLSRLDAFSERRLNDDVAMVALRFDAVGSASRKTQRV